MHKQGTSIEHADYLSRNLPLTEFESEPGPSHLGSDKDVIASKKIKDVNFVELHQGWLAVEQKRDSEIQDLITKHNNGELPETVAHTYDLR